MNTNDNILKNTLLHYINLEYYANEIDGDFQTLLSELHQRCKKAISSHVTVNTKSSYNLIMKVVKEEVEKFRKELEERLEEEAELVMSKELSFLDNTYNKSSSEENKIPLSFTGISLAKLLFAPVVANNTLRQFVEKIYKNIINSYENPLRAGYLFGQDTKNINTTAENNIKQVSKGLKSGLRTIVPSFAKNTDRIIFLNNNVEVVWVATLDGRTCLTCSSLSGLHFKSITQAPSIPHYQCRCQLLPLKCLTSDIPDFEGFIESLDEEEQKHVLGKTRYELWKKDGIKLSQFINNGKVLTLGELEKKSSE